MLTKNVAAIDEELVKPADLQESASQADANTTAMTDTINDAAEIDTSDGNTSVELEEETIEIAESEESDQEVEEQSSEKIADASAMPVDNFELTAASTDTAIITSQMSIVGDVTSSGNMDLIGMVTGNIEILGKLKVTGSIIGNSTAAEIYADSAQINGEIRSNGSVKIGQSSVVIGNIFAASAVIAGAVKGDIDVQGPIILDTSAIVMGNIKSKSVQINNGAVIEGMCSQCYADVSPTAFFDDVKKSKKIE
ncbi:MAG: polymer-forming cytoskeletal protein [Lachnospiraceae bacterium]|nr:polymer-forming cytoskeletal protein [Lachnospiraceae bacterium]